MLDSYVIENLRMAFKYCMGTLTRYSLQELLNCEIGGLDCRVSKYRIYIIHLYSATS